MLAAAVIAVSPAKAVVVGTADTANSIPFGGPYGGSVYQQVYSSGSLGSAININQITFYNSIDPGGSAKSGNFQIYLSYVPTSVDIATFDTNTSVSWLDPTAVLLYSGAAGAVTNGQLNFDLTGAFSYDPSKGNLLLTVKSDLSYGDLFLDVDSTTSATNSRFSAYPYDWNEGLVTGFNVSAVPEPSTWAMLILGFAGVGVLAYRRRSQTTLTMA